MFEVRNVWAGYGEVTVLRGLSIMVPDGSVVALLGPNGAGKTTLLRVASGLLAPDSGQVILDGKDVTRVGSYQLARRGMCHVPEGRGIFPSLTVRENIVLQGEAGSEEASLARATDAFPHLGARLAQPAGTLSGGEQQMLALARAYVRQPRLVLLDEVSMGLAPKVVEAIFEFLRRLAASGAALLLIEQYVVQALELADYVYLMNRGAIAFAGEPSELEEEDVFRSYLGVGVGSH